MGPFGRFARKWGYATPVRMWFSPLRNDKERRRAVQAIDGRRASALITTEVNNGRRSGGGERQTIVLPGWVRFTAVQAPLMLGKIDPTTSPSNYHPPKGT